ncbi:class I SAM-dependent methyltransferase [Pelagicoccus sp. SDUM812005]|uniref:class I SAM-dependent methyltransferase n=1 Tax=Pelagicoccus sp. SDUM812005 TaxID=3041257 RepID=UPI00280E989F|nr:class I SAM-dependent methyltransferase [Pelagicoccus sp. SDUM812005]MDQ8181322.1 class I SAM-dependent methyltransferase [Pelagicoccus sp. SDUM812005]
MERFDPELKDRYPQLYYEHFHRYLVAKEHIQGGRVLDLACGEGYGTALLSQTATACLGIDIDSVAIEQAKRKYGSENVHFHVADCCDTQLESQSFDAIVSFETIEHLTSPAAFVAELKRLLKPNGLLFISSPDKREYTEVNKISNPHHLKELYHQEFKELLSSAFTNCQFSKQRLVAGSLIHADKSSEARTGIYSGDPESSRFSTELQQGLYSFAVCSNAPLPAIHLGLFENKQHSDFSWDAIENYRPTLQKLAQSSKELAAKEATPSVESLSKLVSDIERQNVLAQEIISEKEKTISELHAAVARLESEKSDLKTEVATITSERDNFQERYQNLLSTFSWKVTVPLRALRRLFEKRRSK